MTFSIERNLVNHRPSEMTQQTMESVRGAARGLAAEIDKSVPDGREKSLAFTKLEECVQWTMAALARGDYDKANALANTKAILGEMNEMAAGVNAAEGRSNHPTADESADMGLDPK